MPQHAGQTALLRDFALGCTPFPGDLRVNRVPHNLIGYGVLLLAGFALYKVIVLDREMSMAPNSGLVIWGELRNRVRALLIHPTTYFVRGFYAAPLVSLLAYAAPWALGLRPRRPQAAIPF